METVFSRLRRLEASKDRSLHEMIVDACDAGDALVEALARLLTAVETTRVLPGQLGQEISAAAHTALSRAYVSNGNTPDNGKAVA
jgi:hypothetical protein